VPWYTKIAVAVAPARCAIASHTASAHCDVVVVVADDCAPPCPTESEAF